MRKINLAAFVLLMLRFGVESCKAPGDATSTKTLEDVLTSNSWKMNEIRFLQNNTTYYYKRGAEDNSLDFDSDVVTFKKDNTGTYVGDGITYTLTWNFTNDNKNKVMAIINYPSPLTLYLENIAYSPRSLSYTEYYTRNGVNSLSAVSRIPL